MFCWHFGPIRKGWTVFICFPVSRRQTFPPWLWFCSCFFFVFFSIFHSLPLDVLPIGPTRKLTQTIKKNLFSFETLNLRPLFLRNCLLTQRTTRILIDERVWIHFDFQLHSLLYFSRSWFRFVQAFWIFPHPFWTAQQSTMNRDRRRPGLALNCLSLVFRRLTPQPDATKKKKELTKNYIRRMKEKKRERRTWKK